MESVAIVEHQLIDLLEKSARKLHLKKYSYCLKLDADKGDGFMGEFYKVPLLDEETNTEIPLAIKRAHTNEEKRKMYNITTLYRNEIYFYTTVFPTLLNFQKEKGIKEIFDNVPEYVHAGAEIGREIIAFKDLTSEGFVLREKDLLLDDEHAKFIFSTYGRYHGISFAFKDQRFDDYSRMIEPLTDIFEGMATSQSFADVINVLMNRALEAIDPESTTYEKFCQFKGRVLEIFADKVKYKGKYSGILHGDCWSNNMMFKYQENSTYSQLQNMKLLDFQLVRASTPVHDLSYFFYVGGTKKHLDKIEDYLDVYYESFSKTVRELGSVPEKLLPRKALSEEWKEYAVLGLVMALMVAKMKLMPKKDIVEAMDQESREDEKQKLENIIVDEEELNRRIRSILEHASEIGVI